MSTLDHAIDSLEHLRGVFAKANSAEDVARTIAELAGYREVRDGIPADPNMYYGYLERYEQAKRYALILKDERETNP